MGTTQEDLNNLILQEIQKISNIPNVNIDIINNTCESNSQPLRLPKGHNTYLSKIGAHKNFSEYGSPTNANKPIVDFETPSSVNQACNRVIVSNKGTPETKPIERVISIFFSRYGLTEEIMSFIILQFILHDQWRMIREPFLFIYFCIYWFYSIMW